MDKLTMANSWALKLLEINDGNIDIDYVTSAWSYADAMQAEADKREKEKQDKSKQEQQNYEDALDSISVEQWQPDWSQAPSEFNWFFKQQDGSCHFSVGEPEFWGDAWAIEAGSYSFESPVSCHVDWKDSLRKRP